MGKGNDILKEYNNDDYFKNIKLASLRSAVKSNMIPPVSQEQRTGFKLFLQQQNHQTSHTEQNNSVVSQCDAFLKLMRTRKGSKILMGRMGLDCFVVIHYLWGQ